MLSVQSGYGGTKGAGTGDENNKVCPHPMNKDIYDKKVEDSEIEIEEQNKENENENIHTRKNTK